MTKEQNTPLFDGIVSLAKRRGFVYQGSEIYGGLGGTWDYGPMGVRLKNNIKNLWWKKFVDDRMDMYGVDAAIIMNPRVWKAVGHVDGFTDPLCECLKCKRRFRTDHLGERAESKKCPECGGELGESRQFNMMFETHVGAVRDSSSIAYLRPETAQGIFVNFKNVVDSFHPKLPFGIAQIGKAFRNEITPRDFLFRTREFEQMEIEYFIRENEWEQYFEVWRKDMREWTKSIGLAQKNIHELEVEGADRAHYSKRTIDFEYSFPFGRKELYGLAYRTDFDLRSHSEASSVDLSYQDVESGERFVPHVIEPSFGLDRTVLAVLLEGYTEDTLGDEIRRYLKLPSYLAPVSVAVFPLLRNKSELVTRAHALHEILRKKNFVTAFDDNGNIGKRYRRQDEIGTPLCITVDFTTLEDDTVTVRDRDSGEQERVKQDELGMYIEERISRV